MHVTRILVSTMVFVRIWRTVDTSAPAKDCTKAKTAKNTRIPVKMSNVVVESVYS